jgi:hypothetical protein
LWSVATTQVVRGVRGYSVGWMHCVRSLELYDGDEGYTSFLMVPSPEQFGAVTRVKVSGPLHAAVR